MALTIGFGGGFNSFSGSIDPTSESMVSALEGTSFAPTAFGPAELGGNPFGLGAFGGVPSFGVPSYNVGANPIMQLLPLLLSSLSGLGQGWGNYVGGGNAGYAQPNQFGPVQQQPQQFRGNASHCQ